MSLSVFLNLVSFVDITLLSVDQQICDKSSKHPRLQPATVSAV